MASNTSEQASRPKTNSGEEKIYEPSNLANFYNQRLRWGADQPPTSEILWRSNPRLSDGSTVTYRASDTSEIEATSTSLPALQSRYDVFCRYGTSTMAYATMQPGMNYFEANGGYIAFDTAMGATFVLGDPIGPEDQHGAMIDSFLSKHRNVFFCQISKRTAGILAARHWYLNEIGADVRLDLTDYDFTGPKKSKLRQAAHKMEREAYSIKELPDSEIDNSALENLCSSWLSNKVLRHEGRFLIRPFHFGPEPDVRKFYLFNRSAELCAFVAFDPIFRDGQVIGYSPAIKRRAPHAPVGAEEAITKHAIEKFQNEGIERLQLGLMPLFEIGQSEFGDAWPLRKILQFTYRTGDRWIFNFRGHADFKHRYRGELDKVYFGTQKFLGNYYYMIALLRLCNFI